MSTNFWDPSEGLHGMFDVWSFAGLDVVVCSGLGGGSLIYANVLLRKDEQWFVQEEPGAGYEYWPINRADLEPHYDRVEAMLGATPYPFDHAPYDATPKTVAYRDAAQALGRDWLLPNLAVTFAPDAGGGADPRRADPRAAAEHPRAHRARPAAWSASATSAATSARRTRSTTRT